MNKRPFQSSYANKAMRIVFLGTPDFAVPSLAMLLKEGYHVVGVFTQPDRPAGRSKKVQACAVKEYAVKQGLPVYQVTKIRAEEGSEILKNLKPDLMVTAAFGQILSKENLDTPTIGCINVHGSLLPKYRGAAPIQWAIIDGETQTGITTMLTDMGVDTGDILEQHRVQIGAQETAGELFDRMAAEGAVALRSTLMHLLDGTLEREPQEEAQATHCRMLKRMDGRIDWTKTAKQIDQQVRGMNPWPSAFTHLGEELMKIWQCTCLAGPSEQEAGTVLCANKSDGIIVQTGEGQLSLKEIQLPNTKRMVAKDFLNGHAIEVGVRLQ